MIVLAVCCAKDYMDWVVVDGDRRDSASTVEQRKTTIPSGPRGQQLVWVRKEILELLERHQVEAAAVRVAESGGQSVSLGRAEVEGVVQEALTSAGLAPIRHVAATIRGIYEARNTAELTSALLVVPSISGTSVSGREPVVSAVALLPR